MNESIRSPKTELQNQLFNLDFMIANYFAGNWSYVVKHFTVCEEQGISLDAVKRQFPCLNQSSITDYDGLKNYRHDLVIEISKFELNDGETFEIEQKIVADLERAKTIFLDSQITSEILAEEIMPDADLVEDRMKKLRNFASISRFQYFNGDNFLSKRINDEYVSAADILTLTRPEFVTFHDGFFSKLENHEERLIEKNRLSYEGEVELRDHPCVVALVRLKKLKAREFEDYYQSLSDEMIANIIGEDNVLKLGFNPKDLY